ncbi:DUF3854 domain-containing protein [Cryobacterium sp. TMT1-2-2]|uniref:DUF3854 domain-containing protein n=1 Tax=Cryobacterium sp. TMT1-2-2 TaxID=1259233 RepID=UPI00106A3F95|nr:DUF3854 domain-containing protein [Cryobacterium sp. TMT1-2-2]TFD12890.1 DUF3854 domain-containing protein [Cryobacterium sp. TMT1-2-2]
MTNLDGNDENRAGSGDSATDVGSPLDDYLNLTREHAQELRSSAIPASVAAEQGIRSAYVRDDLPKYAQWIANRGDGVFPTLVFPMTHPDGSETGQVKPAPDSVTTPAGLFRKYVSPGKESNPPTLPELRAVKDAEVVLIVEGVKQALAALAWAPDTWSIYRIAGIWAWRVAGDGVDESGSPTPFLAVVRGRPVVIIPDADAKTNIRVYDGAAALGEACEGYGAASVKFARLPGADKDGLDDLLARQSGDDARHELLQAWVTNAKSRPADLPQRQRDQMRKAIRDRAATGIANLATTGNQFDGRVGIDVSRDMRQVSLDLLDALIQGSGGVRVFQRDGELVRVRRSRDGKNQNGVLKASALTRSALRRELLDVVYPYTTPNGSILPAGLADALVDLVADHSDRFPWLSGITRSPLVLTDGAVSTTPGYNPENGVFLDLTPDVQGIVVPEHPTDADIAAAAALIRDDLFAMDGVGGRDGWAFASEADQTHAIAGLITPVIRANVGKVPMLVFDGIHRGVGKGGCLDVIHRVAFGVPASIQTTPKSDEEMDKRITAKLRVSADTINLDEVQDKDGTSRLDSNSLGAVLTSEIYEGRKLGTSEVLSLPNMASWYGLGNNVQIPGDMIRRVYTCRLASDRTDLETRDNFRHDLDSWVPENRAELLRAVLILVRAWYAEGQPEATKPFGFKSFTEWQRVVGGILHHAGINGFLSTVLTVRETADSEAVDNGEHWKWVEGRFPVGTKFGASEVLAQAKADPDASPPYGKAWDELDARKLSMYYGQHPRWYDRIRIRQDGKVHAGGKAYVIEQLPAGVTPLPTPSSPPTPAPGPAAAPAPAGPRPAAGAAPGELIEFTGRKGFTQRVARAMPPMSGKTIAELGGDAS